MRLFLLLAVAATFGFSQSDPHSIIQRAADVTGFSKNAGKILHWHDMQGVEHDYESPAPFITIPSSREAWFDPTTGVERASVVTLFPGSKQGKPAVTLLTPRGIFSVRDRVTAAVSGSAGVERDLNLWAVLTDWVNAKDLRLLPNQVYADYPRQVLARRGEFGEERLFIDPKTGFPVKLDRDEPHYLWGQVHVEYVYTFVSGAIPTAAARVVDGFKTITRTIGDFEFIDRSNSPDTALPDVAPAASVPLFLQPLAPARIDVSKNIFLSVNRGYTEAVALIEGTIYVLDSTQGEQRAKQDLEMIQKAFPGPHPIVLVVTDLAWPHIAGIRFWVSQGATVISHRASKAFLEKVIARRWTMAPDTLERNRKKMTFVAVDQDLTMGGGKLKLTAIDGIGSEGALMAYLPGDRLLWASDYIQSVTRPTEYTAEVFQAVRRAGFAPEQVAAMHIPLTEWSKIAAMQTK